MQVVVFGVGKYYQKRKQRLKENVKIVAFIDNNSSLWGTMIDGVKVVSPKQICTIVYDRIILMSLDGYAMKCQLTDMGIEKEKIYYYEEHLGDLERGKLQIYYNEKYAYNENKEAKKILIISNPLNYDGAPMTAMYAALAMSSKGYQVSIAASDGNKLLIEEMHNQGLDVILYKNLSYASCEELFWVNMFEVVLVNTFPMIRCACEISKIKPVILWIHEATEVYRRCIDQYLEYISVESLRKMKIYAVTNIARNNFNLYFSVQIHKLLPYGIPDYGKPNISINDKEELVFAIIGGFSSGKAQDVFVEAVKLLDCKTKEVTQFWLIGAVGDNEYSNKIVTEISEDLSFKILGELTRNEIYQVYEKIDVIVCPSLEETMSLAITEGMMYGKVCIASSAIGMAEYIINEENGLICSPGDPMDLSKKMEWVIRHRNDLYPLQIKARKTYEKYFSMKTFGDNLENALMYDL